MTMIRKDLHIITLSPENFSEFTTFYNSLSNGKMYYGYLSGSFNGVLIGYRALPSYGSFIMFSQGFFYKYDVNDSTPTLREIIHY